MRKCIAQLYVLTQGHNSKTPMSIIMIKLAHIMSISPVLLRMLLDGLNLLYQGEWVITIHENYEYYSV